MDEIKCDGGDAQLTTIRFLLYLRSTIEKDVVGFLFSF